MTPEVTSIFAPGALENRRISATRVLPMATWVHGTPTQPIGTVAVTLECSRGPVMTIDRDRDEILRLAARYGARNVRVFGSVARGEDRADSDIDLLVEMDDNRSLLDLVGLEQELEELLRRDVDVLTDASLHPDLRVRIAAEARAL